MPYTCISRHISTAIIIVNQPLDNQDLVLRLGIWNEWKIIYYKQHFTVDKFIDISPVLYRQFPDCLVINLSFKREICDLIYCFKCKITHFDVDRYVSFNVTHGRPTTRLSSDPYMLSVSRCKTESHKYFYFQLIVPIWNQLPFVARSDASLLSFKSQMSKFYRAKFASSFLTHNVYTWMYFCHCSFCRCN